MSEADRVFAGSIPALYDRYLVPLIFAGYADDLARRVAQGRPQDVLETAAGTGIVTRALDRMLAPEARITATDLNQSMLDHAAAQLANGRVV
ncbi:MAG TPA: methyltransferase domain-containing protein, partial [Stellaceae bacterium]|nr:methyltransferase domain-containing protein [Stellaceae bacterium]